MTDDQRTFTVAVGVMLLTWGAFLAVCFVTIAPLLILGPVSFGLFVLAGFAPKPKKG